MVPKRRRRLRNQITFAGPEGSSRAAGLQDTTRNLRIWELAAIVRSLRQEINSGRSVLPETRQVNQNRRENAATGHQAACKWKALLKACRGIEPDVDDVPCQPGRDQPGKREHGIAEAQRSALTGLISLSRGGSRNRLPPPPQKPT